MTFFIYGLTHAQEVLVASGGNLSYSGSSVSYSVGQIFQNTNTASNGSAIQGIQFYFPNSTLNIVEMNTNSNIATYPNPTSSILNLKIQQSQDNNLSYKLFNLLGESLINGKIISKSTLIDIDHLPMATYLLHIYSRSNQSIKTFKIIKN